MKKIQCILTALFLLPMTTFANPMPHGVPILTPIPKLPSRMSHKVALVEELVQIYDRLPSYVPSFMPKGFTRKDYTLSLSGAKVKGRKIVYDFGNFVPKKDLLVKVRR